MGVLEGLSSEFSKLAEAETKPVKKPSKLGKWLKNTAFIGAGYGVGHGTGMLIDKGLEKAFGDKWRALSTPARKKILGPAMGIASAGAFLTSQYLNHKRMEAMKGE